ncbi:MAG: alpha/beta fold hydrolase, partial [Acidimicrobiia bacterium]|nr:alpha/beta fold hydrolase [Acidimicrobiia bacterium]
MGDVISPLRTLDVESTDNVVLKLHHLGGSGPPLIICHATGFNGMAYGPMARYLTGDFDIWAVDFRGHGASNAPASGDFAWSGMAADLLACIEAI